VDLASRGARHDVGDLPVDDEPEGMVLGSDRDDLARVDQADLDLLGGDHDAAAGGDPPLHGHRARGRERGSRGLPGTAQYLVVSGVPAPEGIPALVAACQAAGWRVVVFSTPAGSRFIDPAELEGLTGEPVRSEYRMPGTGSPVPAADAVLACPLTFNSVNKFAHGHADNFAVGLLCEMASYGVPVVVVPHCKP
jgi:hypothetical protein